MFFGFVTLVFWLASLVAAEAAVAGPVVDLGYAKFQGVHDPTYDLTAYYGIRFAAPPTGDLRFRAPVPIEEHNSYRQSEIVDASQPGPWCIQAYPPWMMAPSDPPTPQAGEEDCLLVDVLVPEKPNGKSLPVWVQVHGGGFNIGFTSAFPGFALVNQSQGDMIFVSVQYRLNAFGFLGSSDIKKDGTANAGLLDQRAALDWVQRHISSFDGDPSRVTVSGNSAGGSSVVHHLIHYGDQAESVPFHQAIVEYAWFQPFHSDAVLEKQYHDVLSAAKCSDLACLRSVDSTALNLAASAALISGYDNQEYGYGDFYFGPTVDGKVIRELPENELRAGNFAKVPLLVDREGYEGVIFTNASLTTKAEELADLETLFPSADEEFFRRLFYLYPDAAFNSTFFQRQKLFGDFSIDCPSQYIANAFSQAGQSVWKMIFDAGTKIHGSTATFLFPTAPTPATDVQLSLIMRDWFLSFAIHGNPNTHSYSGIAKPDWAEYSAAAQVMSVNATESGVMSDFDRSEQCAWWSHQTDFVNGFAGKDGSLEL